MGDLEGGVVMDMASGEAFYLPIKILLGEPQRHWRRQIVPRSIIVGDVVGSAYKQAAECGSCGGGSKSLILAKLKGFEEE
jgi:hypothetical protein